MNHRNRHELPEGLRSALDLHVPPAERRSAAGYQDLLARLEELGRRLDEGPIPPTEFHAWEHDVVDLLHPEEIDLLMRRIGEDEMDLSNVQEERWLNLRNVLLARKGLGRS